MSAVGLSLTLMWKGMVAIFVVMIAIFLILQILSPKKKKEDKDQK